MKTSKLSRRGSAHTRLSVFCSRGVCGHSDAKQVIGCYWRGEREWKRKKSFVSLCHERPCRSTGAFSNDIIQWRTHVLWTAQLSQTAREVIQQRDEHTDSKTTGSETLGIQQWRTEENSLLKAFKEQETQPRTPSHLNINFVSNASH